MRLLPRRAAPAIAAPLPAASSEAVARRVVMFVLNPVSRDRRVIKEAASLVDAGYRVTVVGLQSRKDPHPARERRPEGFDIVRVPINMAPEWWRPSPRYLINVWLRLKLAWARGRGRTRLFYQRRRRRSEKFVARCCRTWRAEARLFINRRRHRVRKRWAERHDWRRQLEFYFALRWLRLRVNVLSWFRGVRRSWRRLQHNNALRLRNTVQRLRRLNEPAVRAEVGQELAPLRPTVSWVLLPLKVVAQIVFFAWALLYLGIDRLSGWQITWLLNTRQRWGEFARRAAIVAPAAAVYHGHDFSALAAANAARTRHGGIVIYDSHEVYLEAGANGKRPAWPKWIAARFEARMYRAAAALITVNQMVGDVLHSRYGAKRTVLIHNAPPRWYPPDPWPNLLRETAGIPDESPVALYHGGLTAVRGLRQLAAALLEPGMDNVHLVYMGFGPMEAELAAMSSDPRYGGRLHVVPPVAPEELDAWVASADVGLMPNQPDTLNEIVSSPNKLFENLAAGVAVVTSDFPERRRIVLEDPLGPLGAVCDPTDPASIAAAILSVVGGTVEERWTVRRRCLQAAHERWNWETEEAKLCALYVELLGVGATTETTPAATRRLAA